MNLMKNKLHWVYQSNLVTSTLRFFMMTVLFLLFDIEMVLLLPLPISLSCMPFMPLVIMMGLFMFLLVGGLYFEWQQGSLEWN